VFLFYVHVVRHRICAASEFKEGQAYSVRRKSPVAKTRLRRLAMPHVFLLTSQVYREARLE